MTKFFFASQGYIS